MVKSRDLAYFEIEGATHSEAAWASRVGPFLRFLFPFEELVQSAAAELRRCLNTDFRGESPIEPE